MVLVLVIGDLHVPARAGQVPPKFKTLLQPGRIQTVLCTGNLCSKDTYDFLRSVAGEVHVVRGNMDSADPSSSSSSSAASSSSAWPETKVVTVEKFKIGLCHGHQVVPWGDRDALATLQRQLDCDVLVTGHTHQFESFEAGGKFFVNPGSATGAFSSASTREQVPSFVLMDVQGDRLTCYLYRLIDGEVRVDKSEFVRKETPAFQSQ